MSLPKNSGPLLVLILGMVCTVVGSQFLIYRGFGGDLPLRDEWQYVVQEIILPDLKGTLDWHTFFSPLNHHYLVYSKLLAWSQWRLTGQIDFLVANALNSYLTTILAVLVFLVVRQMHPGVDFYWAGFCTLLFSLPHSFEGLFISISNGYLFFCLLAMLVFLLLPLQKFSYSRLIVAVSLGAAGTLSYMTGYLASAAVLIVLLWQAIVAPQALDRRTAWKIFAAFTFAMILCRWLFPVPSEEVTAPLNIPDQLLTLHNALAWPLRFFPGGAFLTWFPVLACAWVWGRFPNGRNAKQGTLLSLLVVWSAELCLAIAVARNNPHGSIYSRYEIFLVFNLVANSAALGFLWSRVRPPWRTVLYGWAVLLGVAFLVRTLIVSTEYLPLFSTGESWQQQQMGRYLYQRDPELIPQEEPSSAGMFRQNLRDALNSQDLRPYLPPSIIPSLPFVAEGQPLEDSAAAVTLSAPPPRYFPWMLDLPSRGAKGAMASLWLEQNFPQPKAIQFWVLGEASDVHLQEAKTGRRYLLPSPDHADNRWESVTINLPPGSYELQASAGDSHYWLAGGFAISKVGLAVRWAIYQAGYLLGLGLILLLSAGLFSRKPDLRPEL